jgi:hypothetical protein
MARTNIMYTLQYRLHRGVLAWKLCRYWTRVGLLLGLSLILLILVLLKLTRRQAQMKWVCI